MHNATQPLKFKYRNWKGVERIRTVIPLRIYWGKTPYHKEEQWLMEAYDLEKEAMRDFAVRDIIKYI